MMVRQQDWRGYSIKAISGQLAAVLFVAGAALPSAASAKTLVDYFQPTPIACPLTKSTWRASSSVPRDTCNAHLLHLQSVHTKVQTVWVHTSALTFGRLGDIHDPHAFFSFDGSCARNSGDGMLIE